jgi:hypothetical protein
MFFKDEAELPRISIKNSPYAQYFDGNGPEDSKGRSLYDFRLAGRMFEVPFSYMVYSDAFQQLPAEALEYLTAELKAILDPDFEYEGYEHITKQEKVTIRQILEETTIDL